ncbi:MAG: hypothetical protein ABIQ86_08675 [Steroidobacteraceae bacterium]
MSQKRGEVDCAEKGLSRMGYDETIFSFDHVPDKKLGSDIEPPVTGVIVTNTETQQQKIYYLEQEPQWSAPFLEDVRTGVFGPPPKGLSKAS